MMTDSLTTLLLPGTIFAALLAMLVIGLNWSLRHDAKRRERQEPRLPYAKRA